MTALHDLPKWPRDSKPLARRRQRSDPLGRLRTADRVVIWHESGITGRCEVRLLAAP